MSILDFILPEDQDKYNEIIARAAEAKANAPRAPRKPMSNEKKLARAQKMRDKFDAEIAALKAEMDAE